MMFFIYSTIFLLASVADPVAGFGGGNKHEIYAAAYGSHLFYDLFSQSLGGMVPLAPSDPLLPFSNVSHFYFHFCE